ncbi:MULTISPECIES: hypothetical protein [unclassified Moorena]|uniref:hypothetical protein n=1 Tax=unclassified Moorena TaxID=2683338 RepID=UPI0013B88149|nr:MULTISPECIES: hypothetical protein [unclassified Moorena]NEQ05368.1 hypothetical protein [Moorena sp. SIO4E2]NEQ12694.1 hypothetical protein [Moorena sp. SIO3E2]NES45564.1 hypothetical protein [Moorena sp. SIO2C4]
MQTNRLLPNNGDYNQISKHMRYAHAARTALSTQLILFKTTDCATRTLRQQ